MGKLEQQDIGLRSLQENIDTTTSGGRLVFHLFGALAEFERNLIRERTQRDYRQRGREGVKVVGQSYSILKSAS